MGLWSRWTERFFQQYGEKRYMKGECTLNAFIELIKKGYNTVKMVTGELDPDLYNREDVTNEIHKLLDNEVTIESMFHKSDDKKSAIQALREKNGRMVKLKKDHPDYLKLYWQRERSRVHFTVVDSSHILIEDIHDPHELREVLVKYKTKLLGERWDKKFDDLKNKEAEEIILSELDEN
jgi:hypothetical protein